VVEPFHGPIASGGRAGSWEFLSTFVAVLVAIGMFFILDLALARVERRESAAHAADLYDEGNALLAKNDPHDATTRFAAAVAIERTNLDYQLALGEAMLADGRVDDASDVLRSVLSHAETDGSANIAMAHVLVSQGRLEEAKSYYHRAIYGRWRSDAPLHRRAARLELIDMLAQRHETSELLAELLPLEDVAADSIALRRRLGHLFITAGSPTRAVAIFRDLLRRNANDADAYAGLGEAALASGNFHTAHADLLAARRIAPSQPRVDKLLAVTDTIIALNPDERGLTGRQRLDRARTLLARTLAFLERCPPPSSAADSARYAAARAALAEPVRLSAEETARDALLNSANDLWDARPARCEPDATPADAALAMIQARLAQ
jgi:tetratricopeptide (TPR) repeat protein